jgi:tetratricopeptide (TPR) repeat protein
MGKPPLETSWVCDAEADAAVDRQQWEQAYDLHQALLLKEPGNCLAMYHLGYILGAMGDRTQETRQYERAVQCGMDKDDLLFFNLGMAYGEMDSMDKALAAFERAVALNPNNAENFFGLGLTAQAAGQSQRAQTALVNAVKINPNHWEARILLTRIYLDSGRLAMARNHLEFLRRSIPNNEEVVELWQTYEDRSITTFEP